MNTVRDVQAPTHFVTVSVRTSVGRINFLTDRGNKLEAIARLREQRPGITWVDSHHATVRV